MLKMRDKSQTDKGVPMTLEGGNDAPIIHFPHVLLPCFAQRVSEVILGSCPKLSKDMLQASHSWTRTGYGPRMEGRLLTSCSLKGAIWPPFAANTSANWKPPWEAGTMTSQQPHLHNPRVLERWDAEESLSNSLLEWEIQKAVKIRYRPSFLSL